MEQHDTPAREVRLVDVPVGLYRQAQQHTDALLRELVLMAEFEAASQRGGPMRRLFEQGAGDVSSILSRAGG